MAGNPTNAAVWGGADVLIGAVTAVIPTGNADFKSWRNESITTTNASAAITGPAGTFDTALDPGQSITGTGIPAGTTILSVTSDTSATLSANATASGTVTAEIGATTGWRFAGLLDGGQGFEESIETESTDHEAWGYGVIATTYKGTKVTKTFTSVEENRVVMGLVYDVDGMTFDDAAGTYSGDLAVRDNTERIRMAFQTTSGDTIRRQITKNYATVAASAAGSESEESLGSKGFTATIVPDTNKVLYYTYKGAV
jgi:hypothetical protein